MTEFRFENHYYKWTVIDTHTVNEIQYALAESSIGDEAPYILFIANRQEIKMKDFTNKTTRTTVRMPFVPQKLIISDEVYDDIMTALYDNNII